MAGGVLFAAGQIGAAMPEPGVLREPSEDMAESVQITMGYLDQVTQAAGLDRSHVFEVSAFPKVAGQRDLILQETVAFLGKEPLLFNYHEVFDVAMHALIEMDWMARADDSLSLTTVADWLRPLGNMEPSDEPIDSGPFVMWNHLGGHGADLGEASEALLADVSNRLAALGGSMDDLVKLTVYLQEFDPYPMFNEATKKYFADIIPPARSVLVAPGVTGSAKVVLDVLALKP